MNKTPTKIPASKVIVLVAMILILLLVGTAVYCYACLAGISGNAKESVATCQPSSNGVVNVLVTGTDLSGSRTDSIMIVSCNQQSGAMKIVSVPRDTLVRVDGERQKINAMNVYGGESLLIAAVQNLLGIDIHHYVSINYEAFDRAVDGLGGVQMTVPYNMDYDDPVQNLHIHFAKGETLNLTGKEAEEFFRWRKNNDGSGLAMGDIGRIDNEHLLVSKILLKVKSPAGMVRVPLVLGGVSPYVKTDMNPADMIRYGLLFARTDESKQQSATLQGTTPYIGGVSYFVYSESKNAALVAALRDDPGASFKSTAKVEVLNCTGRAGLAASYAQLLRKKGFVNVSAGNGTRATASTAAFYGVESSLAAAVRGEFGVNTVTTEQTKGDKYDIVIRLGSDFKLVE